MKKTFRNWNILTTNKIKEIFKWNIGMYNYWVKKLQDNNYLWKFERSIFVFDYSQDYRKAIINYLNFKKIPFYFWWMELFNSIGYTTQISQTLEIFNTNIDWLKKINNIYFSFHKIKKCYFWKWILENWEITKERFIIDIMLIWQWYISENRSILNYLNGLKSEIEKINISSYIKNYPNLIKQKILWFLETINARTLEYEINNSKVKFTKHYIKLTKQKWRKENIIKNTKTNTLFYY